MYSGPEILRVVTKDESATIWSAFHQLETYQAQIPALFATNAALVISDGVQARIGALGAGREWFKPWRTITGREDAAANLAELQVVLEGVFERRRFLDLVRHFIVFEFFYFFFFEIGFSSPAVNGIAFYPHCFVAKVYVFCHFFFHYP